VRRNARSLAVASMALAICLVPPVNAAGPKTSIQLLDSPGFTAVSEVSAAGGAVIDTFTSGDVTVKVIGTPGSTVKLSKKSDAKSGQTTVTVDMGAKADKASPNSEYAASGRSAVKDVIALGAEPEWAAKEFGDMDVMDPTASAQAGLMASTQNISPVQIANAVTPSSTTPYASQCANISAGSGEVEGYGCSTLYLVSIPSAGNWYFNNKYKFSVHGEKPNTLECILFAPLGCQWRVVKAGWSIQWASGNVVEDWDPASAINKSSCSSTTLSAEYRGAKIGITTDICPDKIQPWNLAMTKSGSEWVGISRGTDYVATIGLQQLHSPAGVPASYNSPMNLVIARLNT
jgi:hypothetical protein